MNTIAVAIISLTITYASMTWLIKRHNDICRLEFSWIEVRSQPLSGVGGWLSLAFYVFGIVQTNSGNWSNIIAKLIFGWYMWLGAAIIVTIIAISAEMLYRKAKQNLVSWIKA